VRVPCLFKVDFGHIPTSRILAVGDIEEHEDRFSFDILLDCGECFVSTHKFKEHIETSHKEALDILCNIELLKATKDDNKNNRVFIDGTTEDFNLEG